MEPSHVLVIVFAITLLLAGILGGIIHYHFRTFGVQGDPWVKRILTALWGGTAALTLIILGTLLLALFAS